MRHLLEAKLTYSLTIFNHKRYIMSPNLKSSSASLPSPSEARIKEAGIVCTQLTTCWVICNHLGSEIGWDADAFSREEKVKRLGFKDYSVTTLPHHGFPEVRHLERIFGRKVK